MEIAEGRLFLRGACLTPVQPKHAALTFAVHPPHGKHTEYPCELTRRSELTPLPYFEKELWEGKNFETSLPLPMRDNSGITVRAFVNIDGEAYALEWSHGKSSPFVRGNKASYLARAGYLVSPLQNDQGLFIERSTLFRLVAREMAFLRQVAAETSPHAQTYTSTLVSSVVPNFIARLSLTAGVVACARLAVRALRGLSRKPIWLISDRTGFAGDNGEALFEYLMANSKARRGVRPFFLLARNSEDWERLRQIGPTVAHGTYLHWLLFLAADKVISSAGDAFVTNPFGGGDWLFRNLFNFDFVFLQHGVTKDDQSRWLNRTNKNIALFVTAAERERQAIVEGDYGYTDDQVVLTGFPRHDKLLRKASQGVPQRLVAVMPTWREHLVGLRNPQTGQSAPNPDFQSSEYFGFWNGLLNHPRLLKALRSKEYRLRFVIHPQLTRESDKFLAPEPVDVVFHCDYSQTFCEAALLLTDYSSVAFDFALLKKPTVYAQFDYGSFYSGHIYNKGYFDYERDGFGPVCGDLESTVDAVVRYLENGCGMEPMYRERVDAFFGKQPENRCQAVVDAIRRLGKR